MKLKFLIHPGVLTLIALSALSFAAWLPHLQKTKGKPLPVSAFEKYISAYTGGEISRSSPIVIRFVDEMVKPASVNAECEDKHLLQIKPHVYGSLKWIDTRTLQFKPSRPLPSQTKYEVSMNLSLFIPSIPDSLNHFQFSFRTKKQAYQVAISNPVSHDPAHPHWQTIEGSVKAADLEYRYNIEDYFRAYNGHHALKIRWREDYEGTDFKFTIDSLLRKSEPYTISIRWENYDRSFSGNKMVTIPAVESFVFLQSTAHNYPDQHIVLEFSDPLKEDQVLNGLIRIGNQDPRLDIQGNKIFVYPKERITGAAEILLEKEIQNSSGRQLPGRTSTPVYFEDIFPQVQAIGTGAIIPQSSTLPFVFEAANLSAVDVKVIRITEKNIPQFLQINQLEESRELKRVGTLLLNKKMELGKGKKLDLRKWNRHVLDLSKLVQTEPGAIYQVSVGFRKSYSLYTCEDSTQGDADQMLKNQYDWHEPGEDYGFSQWDYYEYNESYEDIENPCRKPYYHSGRAIVRNVLASNIGLIAKQGSEGSLFVAATDLITASPLSDVLLEVYDYQQQLIASGKTNNGISRLNPKHKAFLLIAKKGKQRGYLRIDQSSSLSLSRFDIGGKNYHKGLKGFIYGERDVWRPGDSLYLNFILEDKLRTLPSGHPVIFEMFNPQQELVQRIVKNSSLNHFYTFHTSTSPDAPTGNYTVKVHAGGTSFEKTVKIETIKPNRLKINLSWNAETIKGFSEEVQGLLSARWLHGGIAQNLKADVTMTVSEAATLFKTHKDYTFSDPARKFQPERKEIFNGVLDDKGLTEIKAKLDVEGTAPGMLKAHFKTKVFEPGGNFSTDYFSIPYHPYETYVGIKLPKGDIYRGMLLTDKDHAVKIATLDSEGNPVSGKKISIELYKLEWKWWWESSEEDEFGYNGKIFSQLVLTDTVTSKDGFAQWKLRINYPEWGRYMIRACEEGGHCTGSTFYIDWPGWAGRARQDNPEGAKMLTFSADKDVYHPGENITLHIPTGFSGNALLTLESGTKVIGSYWIKANKGMTRFSFPATAAMAPNVYAHITLLQPHAQTANDLPIRMYGITPIRVEDPATRLHPVITMAEELKPEQVVPVTIHEKNGRDMTYTLAVVDEGLLDLTRYNTPDIWSHFNQRQALDVHTWDLFDHVAGASAAGIRNLLSIGGDGSNGPLDGAKANRFKPVVIFLGPFHVKGGESKTHRIRLPNYIGSVRTMVIAGNNGAYGKAEKTTPVKKPLMVLGTLPRVLGPNEKLNFPLTLFAMEKHVKNVSVQIECSKLITVEGSSLLKTEFTEPGEKLVGFPLKVKEGIGVARIKVTAVSGKEKAVYETEIEIRNPNPRVENVFQSVLEEGQNWKQPLQPAGMKGTNTTILEVSSIPPLNLGKRLEYLIQYPYGCVEQTTSSVFPQVCLNDLLILPKKRKQEVEKNIRAGIARLKRFQRSDGSLSYWPGGYEANDWGSCYAGHFMLVAEEAGYVLPYGFKDKWKKYIKSAVQRYSDQDELMQGYRLFLLAIAKDPDMGAMNRLRLAKVSSVPAQYYLAAAYYMSGQPEAARELIRTAPVTVKNYLELSHTFGSDERDKAIILECLSIMNERSKATPLVEEISRSLNSDHYLNTQATAYSLIAIARYAGRYRVSTDIRFSWRLKDEEWKEVKGKLPVWEHRFTNDEVKQIEIRNSGGSRLYVQAVTQGVPKEGDQTDASSNLGIEVHYKTMDGKKIDPSSIPQGTDFMAEVTVSNPGTRGYYEQLSLNQIFPSGWEIHHARMDGSDFINTDVPQYQDIRDDRVYTFFDLKDKQQKTFVILLNASYKGEFYLPTVYAEAMYDHSISARRHGQWVKVVKNIHVP